MNKQRQTLSERVRSLPTPRLVIVAYTPYNDVLVRHIARCELLRRKSQQTA